MCTLTQYTRAHTYTVHGVHFDFSLCHLRDTGGETPREPSSKMGVGGKEYVVYTKVCFDGCLCVTHLVCLRLGEPRVHTSLLSGCGRLRRRQVEEFREWFVPNLGRRSIFHSFLPTPRRTRVDTGGRGTSRYEPFLGCVVEGVRAPGGPPGRT